MSDLAEIIVGIYGSLLALVLILALDVVMVFGAALCWLGKHLAQWAADGVEKLERWL